MKVITEITRQVGDSAASPITPYPPLMFDNLLHGNYVYVFRRLRPALRAV